MNGGEHMAIRIVQIVRKTYGVEEEQLNMLLMEQDYLLLSLNEAVKAEDEEAKARCIEELKELRQQIEYLEVVVA